MEDDPLEEFDVVSDEESKEESVPVLVESSVKGKCLEGGIIHLRSRLCPRPCKPFVRTL